MNPAQLQALTADFQALQDRIVGGIEAVEAQHGGATFVEDDWERPGGGGGRTRVLTAGKVWERGGVNFSQVEGEASPALKAQMNTDADRFWAAGVSLVLHPNNPHVPIVHMDVRHFALSDGTSWFGGGIDMTPHYVNPEEATQFHHVLKAACNAHACADYARFKDWADDYFFVPHRGETRGVGGIFFDHLGREGATESQWQAHKDFVFEVGNAFLPAYLPLVHKNVAKTFTPQEREWQLHRRGRYVEFNLVWDRGTRFGLVSNGRTESILMSLPPEVKWTYDYDAGPKERETLGWLKKGIDWAGTPSQP